MEPPRRVHLPFSWKNIPHPSKKAFTKRLIEMTESVIKRMRWKAFFFLRGDEDGDERREEDETYGLGSRRCPPQIDEMKPFEDDLLRLIEDLEFQRSKDNFQTALKTDVDRIRKSEAVFVPADKTRNLYEMDSLLYEKLLHENVTKHYRHAPEEAYSEINAEAQSIAKQLNVADRMDVLARKTAFITLKDHKENFLDKLQCRLINPAKSEIGLISKRIVDRINVTLKEKLRVQQWKNSSEVIDWFMAIEEKDKCVFTCFDVCEFYPSISEELLRKALAFAQKYTDITDGERNIILHSRKSLLFSAGNDWMKNNKTGLFDVTMGCYDGAEVCELVGTYALASLPSTIHKGESIGLYRDDGLAVNRGSGSDAERTKKGITRHFKSLGLKITIETNLKIVNFLDLTLDLKCGKYFPFRKPGDTPVYVHKMSNHPPVIIKNIPAAVSRRITDISSDKAAFDQAAPVYNSALKASGYSESITFLENRKQAPTDIRRSKKRSRNVIWYNPPFSKNVKTPIGKKFLKLLDKHFPRGSRLHKIFNRSTVKISYSCMPNVATIIKTHNKQVLESRPTEQSQQKKLCNCRRPSDCPLNGECLASSIVYKATVAAQNKEEKHYIGQTEGAFKQRYSNHLLSIRHEKYSNRTELSKYIWDLKKEGTNFNISWSICRRAPAYSSGSKRCQLCLAEKLCIITADRKSTLNKRTELVSTCRHRCKFLLSSHAAAT